MTAPQWPVLPYEEWRDTLHTLHMYTQVIGKLRLELSPPEPHWAHAALYVTAHGLATSPLPTARGAVDAELDLVNHALVLRCSDGHVERGPLGASVADFYRATMATLGEMGVEVSISELPSEVDNPVRFSDDTSSVYDGDQVTRFFRVLSTVDLVFRRHRSGFSGRTTPVHFFWGSFDLALTRFSGRRMPVPEDADFLTRYGAGTEDISAGWWPGNERFPHPAFYSYASPKPQGLEQASVDALGAWDAALGEFVLLYDDVRATADPGAAVTRFLESTYRAAAALLDWDPALTEVVRPGHRAG